MAFELFPDQAKTWIYQSNRKLNDSEANWLQSEASTFVETWAAHGISLKAEVKVLDNYFLIIMVDESQAQASGCSIDTSVSFVREAQAKLGVDFFDRLHISYRLSADSPVESASKTEFEELLAQGKINDDTLVFNNLVKNKAEWLNKWQIPFAESWHANFFAKV